MYVGVCVSVCCIYVCVYMWCRYEFVYCIGINGCMCVCVCLCVPVCVRSVVVETINLDEGKRPREVIRSDFWASYLHRG